MTSNLPGEPIDHFRPEFVNRIEEIVRFRSLGRDDLTPIIDIQLGHLAERLAQRRIHLDVTDAAKGALAHLGYDEAFGAPHLKPLTPPPIPDPLPTLFLPG